MYVWNKDSADVTNKKAGTAGTLASAHGYTFNLTKATGIKREVLRVGTSSDRQNRVLAEKY